MHSKSYQEMALAFLQNMRAGDADAAKALVTANARHHNPYFASGMDNLIAGAVAAATSAPDRSMDVQRIIDDGEYVVIHSRVRHQPGDRGVAVVHIFRFENGLIAELWDLGQPVPADNVNADGLF